MSQTCTRCDAEGFLNAEQIPSELIERDTDDWRDYVLEWLRATTTEHDVKVCDCCGDGACTWHGESGEHYNDDDPPGPDGPYGYNGGRCECD